MEVYGLMDVGATDDWILIGEGGNGSFAVGIGDDGSSSSANVGTTGTLTNTLDNTDYSSPTRNTIHDDVKAIGGFVTQGVRGIDLTAGSLETGLVVFRYNSSAFHLDGDARHFIVTTSLTTSERSDLHTWLDGEK